MAATLVDSNVILDVATEDEEWLDWSAARLADAGQRGPLVINPIVYAEVSVRFDTIEALEEAVPPEFYTRAPLSWEAAFWPASASPCIDGAAGAAGRPFPTSSSERTPQPQDSRC